MNEAQELYARLVREHGDPPVLGNVLLSKALGTGGMGTVFKGFHLRLSIPVAVKIMPSSPQGAQMPLQGEAQASARVNHPNVVRVYDLGREGDFFFMIQEYVEGKTAAELVCEAGNGKMLSEHTVLSVGCDIARGLAAIHAAGYLHHDVKPGNIIISSKDDVAKLLDLGIAERWEQAAAHVGQTSSLSGRQDGGPALGQPAQAVSVEGTPGYIAPERVRGLAGKPASDLYGLGVTLYEMLTGKFAYGAETLSTLLAQQLTRELPDILTLRPQLSPATARVVQQCVKINPNERFPDANTLLHELAKALQALEPPRAAPHPTLSPVGRRQGEGAPALLPAGVVCVDDDPEVGGFLRDTLEDAGFRVRFYADPQAGLRGILEEPPDVVITDIHMPGLSGYEVCTAIRAAPSVMEVPVVFLTSDPNLEAAGL
ncbi:MAG: protein kinase, partial [Planctomycetota bacterium]